MHFDTRQSVAFLILPIVVATTLAAGPTTGQTPATQPIERWDLSTTRDAITLPWRESNRTRRQFEDVVDGEIQLKLGSGLTVSDDAHLIGFARNLEDVVVAVWIQSRAMSYEDAISKDMSIADLFHIDSTALKELRTGAVRGERRSLVIGTNVPPLPGQPSKVSVQIILTEVVPVRNDGMYQLLMKFNFRD